ncbi:hypothetical protein LAZ67_11002196 [Cordylochernes scorpioides]|uniref:Reverse transcriptase domain-containing protein n=1 Tax=Cordylochernes scorpioides TaxID=51811 RepID=A0ABY6L2H3_9ARAC|nr:hypothetical protein LAZ67_11002196 [Cordylochernes scorpioides]
MEKIILRRLTYHIETRNLLPEEQYGFRKGHGTIDQLLFFTQKTLQAFDKVWKNKLITKLYKHFKIDRKAIIWINDFLKNRYIMVKYNDTLSKTFKLYQGLPQGSVLSPTLFTLFIAGIEEKISHKTNIGLFADDIILWSSNTNWKKAEKNLNKTLLHLEKFANKHKLEFNPQKSETCLFTTVKKLYKNKHIEEVIRKGRDRLKILKYISGREWGADATTLKLTYTSLIRPILEYGYQIYCTASETNLKSLERITLSAARIITGLRNTCPNDIMLHRAEERKADVICIQETKLRPEKALKLNGYKLIRKDRAQGRGGGGLLTLIKELKFEEIIIPPTNQTEIQGIKLYQETGEPILLFNIYHPPDKPGPELQQITHLLTDKTILLGDFNSKHSTWGCNETNNCGEALSNYLDNTDLLCISEGPTYVSNSYGIPQTLDLVITTPQLAHQTLTQVLEGVGSDHLPLLTTTTTEIKEEALPKKLYWNYRKADWTKFRQESNLTPKITNDKQQLNSKWKKWKTTVLKAAKKTIPRGNRKQYIPGYIETINSLQNEITQRNQAQEYLMENNELENKINLSKLSAQKVLHISKKIRNEAKTTSHQDLFHKPFLPHELKEAINRLDDNKTPGSDIISAKMIKHLETNAILELLHIINLSWSSSTLPKEWKHAIIIPIHKAGKTENYPQSYRPISLTSIPCKLMERMILNRMQYFLNKNKLLTKQQAAFKKYHNTVDQIFYFTQKIQDNFQSKPTKSTIAAFIDLSQAFDRVWKERGKMMGWIGSFLTGRTFQVNFKEQLSKTGRLFQGLPQGSILSSFEQ